MNDNNLQTGNHQFVRSINEVIVLNFIRSHKLISGAELAKKTGMRPSTISSLVKQLKAKGLIAISGKGQSTTRGGKRPTLWRLKYNSRFVIGVDLELGESTAVCMNLRGDIIERLSISFPRDLNIEQLNEKVGDLIENLLINSKIKSEQILGLGFAVPGIIDTTENKIIMSSLVSEWGYCFSEYYKNRFSFPCFIENNANAAAISSKWAFGSENLNHFLTILIELSPIVGGLGVGIVLNNEVYYGTSFSSGELDIHLPTITDVFSQMRYKLTSDSYFSNFKNDVTKIQLNDIIFAGKNNNEIALHYYNRLGTIIGNSISNAVAFFNPGHIVIAGGISEAGENFIQAIKSSISPNLLDVTQRVISYKLHPFGSDAVAHGAGACLLDDFFRMPVTMQKSRLDQLSIS